jgi:hypothetical protein
MIGSGRDHDLFLAVTIDHDQRDAGGGVWIARGESHIDALALEQMEQLISVWIAPDPPDKGDTRAEPRGRDGLVGPFAAAGAKEFGTINGITRARKCFAADQIIEIDPSKDNNVEARLAPLT